MIRLISICLLVVCVSCSTKRSFLLGKRGQSYQQKVYSYKTQKIIDDKKQRFSGILKKDKALMLESLQRKKVIDKALSFQGTKYKYGGISSSGIDCSGLVLLAYKEVDVMLPRSSKQMSTYGKEVSLDSVLAGDLLFFSTRGGRRISHVGIVVEVSDTVYFIHSSTSKGVIVSSLKEAYWKKNYKKSVRVL